MDKLWIRLWITWCYLWISGGLVVDKFCWVLVVLRGCGGGNVGISTARFTLIYPQKSVDNYFLPVDKIFEIFQKFCHPRFWGLMTKSQNNIHYTVFLCI